MENYSGFLEHTDVEVGRLIAASDKAGEMDNTLIFYIVGDNGASGEGGLEGTVNEIASLNGIQLGLAGLEAKFDEIGGPKRNRTCRWAGPGRRTRPSSGPSRSPRTLAARATAWSSIG